MVHIVNIYSIWEYTVEYSFIAFSWSVNFEWQSWTAFLRMFLFSLNIA